MSASTPAQPNAVPREIPGPFDLLWRWLNSLPIAIVVMLLLAGLSAIGTMIPQSHLAQAPQGMTFDQFLEQRYGPLRANFIRSLGWHEIYFTWYYFALMLWLSVSAVICNITRFRRTVKDWTSPPLNRDAPFFKANAKGVELTGLGQDDLNRLEKELRAKRFRVHRGEFRGAPVLYADRGYLRKWALVLLHIAILVLLTGGMIGATFGSKGMIRLADKEKQELVIPRDHNKHWLVKRWLATLPPLRYQLDQTGFRIDYDKKIFTASDVQENVPPELHEYYDYFVRQFVSVLTARMGERTVGPQEVYVNKPLYVEKLVLYQSGYSQLGYVKVDYGDGRVEEFAAPAEQWLVISRQGVLLHEMAAMNNIQVSDSAFLLEQVKAGDLYENGSKTGYIGPLTIAHLANRKTGEMTDDVLVKPDQGFSVMLGGRPVKVTMSTRVDNFSDFSYQRDPGLPILGLGWVLLVIGIAVALYTPFNVIHARAEGDRLLLLVMGQNSQLDDPLPSGLRAMLTGSA